MVFITYQNQLLVQLVHHQALVLLMLTLPTITIVPLQAYPSSLVLIKSNHTSVKLLSTASNRLTSRKNQVSRRLQVGGFVANPRFITVQASAMKSQLKAKLLATALTSPLV